MVAHGEPGSAPPPPRPPMGPTLPSLAAQLAWLALLALPVACVAWTITHEEIFREPREGCRRRCEGSPRSGGRGRRAPAAGPKRPSPSRTSDQASWRFQSESKETLTLLSR